MSENKPGRKPITPDIARVADAIARGDYDEQFSVLTDAIDQRRKSLQEKVLADVRAVYGPDAEIVTVSKGSPVVQQSGVANADMMLRRNPFMEARDKASARNDEAEAESGSDNVEDPMSEMDETEREMDAEAAKSGYISPDARGAIISGLHSSQIAE